MLPVRSEQLLVLPARQPGPQLPVLRWAVRLGSKARSALGTSLLLNFWHGFPPREREPTSSRPRSFSFKCGPPRSPMLCARPGPAWEDLSLHWKLLAVWSAQPGSAHGVAGGAGSGSLHKAVLSVSLSISSRMWPGRSLFAESECISGKMLRSGSETLELVSVTILEAVGAALVRLPSPAEWAPGGWGGGGMLGRFLGFGTGLGLGRVPACVCAASELLTAWI